VIRSSTCADPHARDVDVAVVRPFVRFFMVYEFCRPIDVLYGCVCVYRMGMVYSRGRDRWVCPQIPRAAMGVGCVRSRDADGGPDAFVARGGREATR
jgi:hypothetical protein